MTIPKTISGARSALDRLRRDLEAAPTEAQLREIEQVAEVIKLCFWHVGGIRDPARDIALAAHQRLSARGPQPQLPPDGH